MKSAMAMTDHRDRISVDFGLENDDLPSAEQIRQWTRNALSELSPEASVDIRIVDRSEMRMTNHRYRQIDSPTNVLSFSADLPAELGLNHLGDIMICAPLVDEEAQDQGKHRDDHFAHLVTHGVLHLLGHDHQQETEARIMETLEQQILARIGIEINPTDKQSHSQ